MPVDRGKLDKRLVLRQHATLNPRPAGVTHALFNVNHPGGNMVIGVPDVVGFESVNGLQIAPIPEPASVGLMLAGALGLVRRRR